MFKTNLVAAIIAIFALRGFAQATCPQPATEPVYQCGGGLCYPCPNGSMASMRSCAEATYYASSAYPVFGPLEYKYTRQAGTSSTLELRWTVGPPGDYNAFIQPIVAGVDCPETERNSGLQSCPTDGSPTDGNPINTGIGNKVQNEGDYQGSGAFSLQFHRYYNSVSTWGGRAGTRWTHTFGRRLITQSATEMKLVRDDGEVKYFFQCGSAWCATADEAGVLTQFLDGSGAITGWKYVDENDVTENYDGGNRLVTETSRSGIAHTLSYDMQGRLATVKHVFGHQLTLSYDSNGQLQQLMLPGSAVITYGHDGAGNLVTVTYPGPDTRTYFYDEPGNVAAGAAPNLLTGIEDESGTRFATFKYDSQSRAIDSEHAGGAERIQVSYAVNGTPTIVDAAGASRTYSLQTLQDVKHIGTVTGPVCSSCGLALSYSYNTVGDLTNKTDFNGNQTKYVINSRHLEDSRTEAFGSARARTIATTWHAGFRIPTSISEANRSTSFAHDTSGNVLTRSVTDTSATPNVIRTWSYTYNAFGQPLTEDGPRTDVTDLTTYAYYSCTTGAQCGQLQSITNALGHVTTFDSYNAHGQPTQITDPNGVVTTLGYDSRQRLADRCSGGALPSCTGGELTHLDYWPPGLLKRVTNPDGSFIDYTYDAAHRLTQIQDGAANKVVYTVDAMGNRTAENAYDPSLALKRAHTRVFNTLNQLWKDVNAAGTTAVTTTFGYDSNGNQTSIAAPLSRNSSSLYDELNRLKQITDPASGVTQFGYDADDNLTSVTDPRTLITSYTYTGFGDLKTQASPDTGLTTNTFDSGGNLQTSTDARSAITTYTYDALNRVLTAAYKIGSTTDQTFTYTYDAGTNGKGRLTGASDSAHSMSWSYDAQGRITNKSQTIAGVTKSVGYAYNGTGQLTTVTLPSGQVLQYGYNANNQVTSVTVMGSPSVTIVSNITYDPFGPVTGWTWGSGRTFTRLFDTDGKVTIINSSLSGFSNRTFGYDDAFRITSATDSASGAPNWTYGYDSLDRLNSATKTGTTIGYTYDANGNRLTQTGTSASTYTVSGSSNRLTSVAGTLARSYTYDNSGNSLTTGATTHTYYNSGGMKTAKLGAASTTQYWYNALGQRIKKTGPLGTTIFIYDEAGHLLAESSAGGTILQETVWLGDIPIATMRTTSGTATVYYIHTDQLGTPRKITNNNSSLSLRWTWDPTPFGEGAPNESPTGLTAFNYNLRFPGQYFDAESELNYNYFRDYDPAIGRYVESDLIGLQGGTNTYAYAASSPLAFVDPYGLAGCEESDRDCLQEALNSYSLERSLNQIAGFGVGSALFGAGAQALNKTAVKPRGGIAGGGPSGRYTSYSRRFLGNIGRAIGRASVGAAARAAGILGAGVQAYRLHYEALKIYLDCLAEKKQ